MCAPIAHLYCVMCLAARMPVLSALFFQAFFFPSFSHSLRRAAFSSQLKSKVGHILAKAAALRINLNYRWCTYCESAPFTNFAIKAIYGMRNNNWIQLLFRIP